MKLPPFRETTIPLRPAAAPGSAWWPAGLAAVIIAATVIGVLLVSRAGEGPAGTGHDAVSSAGPGAPDALSTAPFSCLGSAGLGIGHNLGQSPSTAELSTVTATAAAGYDRLTVQFAVAVPSQVSLSTQAGAVFAQEPGRAVTLDGAYGALLTFTPADGHLKYRGPTDVKARLGEITELREVRDSDAIVQWAIGLSGAPCYRLAYLTDPLRLAVDFQAG